MKAITWKGTGWGEGPAKLTGKNKMTEIVEKGKESQKPYDKIAIFSQSQTWEHILRDNLIIGQNTQSQNCPEKNYNLVFETRSRRLMCVAWHGSCKSASCPPLTQAQPLSVSTLFSEQQILLSKPEEALDAFPLTLHLLTVVHKTVDR